MNVTYEIITDDKIKVTDNDQTPPKVKIFSKKDLLVEKNNRTLDIEQHNEKISYHTERVTFAQNRISEIDEILNQFNVGAV